MVKIRLKGIQSCDIKHYNPSVLIGNFCAGVQLESDGSVVIQITSKELTKEFQKVFKNEVIE